MYPEKPTCHEINPVFTYAGEITWEERSSGYRHCSYCGSLHPEDLLKAFEQGATLSGSDWKYGWPHKWYVENGTENPPRKFYNIHLNDIIDQPEFAVVAKAIFEKFDGGYYPRVAFVNDNGKLFYGTTLKSESSYEEMVEWAKKRQEERDA